MTTLSGTDNGYRVSMIVIFKISPTSYVLANFWGIMRPSYSNNIIKIRTEITNKNHLSSEM